MDVGWLGNCIGDLIPVNHPVSVRVYSSYPWDGVLLTRGMYAQHWKQEFAHRRENVDKQ